jgi:hypothetical protein
MIGTLEEEEIKNWQDLVGLEQEYSLNRDGKEWVYRGQPTLKYRLCSTLERAFEDFEVRERDRAEIERRILVDW